MKQSYEINELFENDIFIGYFLKADFVSEHEWGIKGIKNKFGIFSKTIKEQVDEKSILRKYKLGFQTNQKTNILNLQKTKKGFYLFTDFSYSKLPYKDEILYDYEDGAWDEDNFIIFSKDEKYFQEILTAEKNKDLTITLGSSETPFDNGGLYILIKSRLLKEIIDKSIKEGKEVVDIYEKMKKTDIENILKKAGKGYFALTPKLVNNTLKFWLNPENQRDYNFGWYTLEELKEWAEDKGPVINRGK